MPLLARCGKRGETTSFPGSHMQDFATLRTVMVDTQVRPQDVTKFNIIEAMLTVAREAYLPESLRNVAYVGENVLLPGGRTVLEPRTQGKMLDALNVGQDELVLDLGCGLGYSAAVLAHLAEAVVAVEEIEGMAEDAQSTLGEQGVDNVAVIEGALVAGSAKHGPFDVICVEGGVEVIPAALTDQLKDGGRIAAIFMDGALGECRIGHKLDGKMNWRMAFNATAPVLPGFTKQSGFVL